MKLLIVASILLLPACNVKRTISEDENLIKEIKSTNDVRLHAEALLAGKTYSLSLETALLQNQMYDSINSPIDTTRVFYLKVAQFLIKRGDALLDKQLGNNLIILLNNKPKEFIEFFYYSEENHIYDVGTNMGAYIANYMPEKEESILTIEKMLTKHIQANNFQQVNFVKLIMKAIRHTVKALSHSR